jgi:uncharacterized protein YndB with AHSA1/START domain
MYARGHERSPLGTVPRMTDAVRTDVAVEVSPERAFEVFTGELSSWWPPEYSWSQDVLEDIGIEPREGGLCFERGPYGFRCDWGRVLDWDPPRRLVIAWQISPGREPEPNPAKASEVEVSFEEDGEGGTSVRLEHRAFDCHGDNGAEYARMLGSPQGWPLLLDRFGAACGGAAARG